MDGELAWSQIDDRSDERPPPADEASDLDWLLYEQQRVLTARQALTLLSRSRLRHLVRTGRWRSARKGLLVAHDGPLSRDQQLWLAVLAANAHAFLAGLTGAQAGGLRRLPLDPIHIVVPAETRRARTDGGLLRFRLEDMPRVQVHRSSHLPAKDLLTARRPPRTTAARSVVDAAQWASSDDEARAVVAAACQQRLAAPIALREVVQRMPRAHRRAVVLETIGFAEGGADALSEIDFAKLCRRYGLPEPDRQVRRTDRRGRRRFLDVYWGAFRLHVEIDGAWHTDVEQWWSDMRRQNDLWIAGDRVLRFPAFVITTRPAEVAAQLREALRAGGWRP